MGFCRRARFLVHAALIAAAAFSGGARAQTGAPVVERGAAVNAASFLAHDLPGGAIAQGSLFTIFGRNLGPEDGVSAGSLPLTDSLAGVSIEVTPIDGPPLAALPLFVSSSQMNALMPSTAPVGKNYLQVRHGGGVSTRVPVKVVRSAFGIFSRNASAGEIPGPRIAAVQNFVDPETLPLNSFETPARPGQTVTLWGTGLGPIETSDASAPVVADLNTPVRVFVGTEEARITHSGRSPCCPGVDQINFEIPADAPPGCRVPVSVEVQNVVYSNIETVSVSASGEPCPEAQPAQGPSTTGRISLLRNVSGGQIRDTAEGAFVQGRPGLLSTRPGSGVCGPAMPRGFLVFPLDAGPRLLMEGPLGSAEIPARTNSAGQPLRGRYRASPPPGVPLLGPGDYAVTGVGGEDVGRFRVAISVPEPPVVTSSFDEPASRAAPLELQWQGAPAARNTATVSGREGLELLCSARSGGQSVSFPPALLANLRGTEKTLTLTSLWAPPESRFRAIGLEEGALQYAHSQAVDVTLAPLELASTPVALPNGRVIQAEVASESPERQRGLMHRPRLAEGRGMLFLFENPGRFAFWMFQTLIPLDIIWMDSDRRIVFISHDTPPCESETGAGCPTFGGRRLAQFVLEIPAGQAKREGLQTGDRLDW